MFAYSNLGGKFEQTLAQLCNPALIIYACEYSKKVLENSISQNAEKKRTVWETGGSKA